MEVSRDVLIGQGRSGRAGERVVLENKGFNSVDRLLVLSSDSISPVDCWSIGAGDRQPGRVCGLNLCRELLGRKFGSGRCGGPRSGYFDPSGGNGFVDVWNLGRNSFIVTVSLSCILEVSQCSSLHF